MCHIYFPLFHRIESNETTNRKSKRKRKRAHARQTNKQTRRNHLNGHSFWDFRVIDLNPSSPRSHQPPASARTTIALSQFPCYIIAYSSATKEEMGKNTLQTNTKEGRKKIHNFIALQIKIRSKWENRGRSAEEEGKKPCIERIEKSNRANSNLTTHIYFAAIFSLSLSRALSSLFAQLTQTECNFLSLSLSVSIEFSILFDEYGLNFLSVDFHTYCVRSLTPSRSRFRFLLPTFSAGIFFCACVFCHCHCHPFNPKNCLHVCFNCCEREL